jgi:hypothetical protein
MSKKISADAGNSLRNLRNAYGRGVECTKQSAVRTLIETPPRSPLEMLRLHEDLLFLRAFPGDAKTVQAANRALRAFEKLASPLFKSSAAAFDDTGVTGSLTRHIFDFPIVDLIANHHDDEVEIDWRRYGDPSQLDPLLRAFARKCELEAFDGGKLSTRNWMKLARGAHPGTDLQWLMAMIGRGALKRPAVNDLWAAAEVPIRWSLKGSQRSTTRNILTGMPVVFRNGMRRAAADPLRRIATPLKKIELLPGVKARRVIEIAKSALASRCREVTAITYPNPDEVYWCDLGEGVALAVISVAPKYRLLLETNTGYLLFSNGVPIGYGGVTPLFRQANTGVNIFDAFRGSEAAFLWVEMLRAFHSLYGSKRFIVNGYQFGEGNSEAINSGAYWFYYRIGFRPADPAQKTLAAREFILLQSPGAARSSKATLKALAKGDLVLDLPGFEERDAFDESLLTTVSTRATERLAAEHSMDRRSAERLIAEKLARDLGLKSMHDWTTAERNAFTDLAPIISLAPDIVEWPEAEKKEIVKMMRAKGGRHERDFARSATRCGRLFRTLATSLTQ